MLDSTEDDEQRRLNSPDSEEPMYDRATAGGKALPKHAISFQNSAQFHGYEPVDDEPVAAPPEFFYQ
jgi:hypothetical protein